ncbi:MAG: MotA/TolQ/ExbB proton channel family protein [Chthoniobacterales bacterium]
MKLLSLPSEISRVAFMLGALLITATPVFAQEATAEVAEETPGEMSILETILHGGPLIILIWIAILATSIVMVTFIIQLFLNLRREKLAPQAVVDSLRSTIDAGNYQEAWEICRANNAYLPNVLEGAFERFGRGKEAVEITVAEHAMREAQTLKTQNSYLSVIGVIAPMIGLLGTVIGMMGAFAVLGQSGVSDPRALALSIGEVLMATASGLFIAIPAFIFYYYFRNKTTIALVDADDTIFRLIEDVPFAELGGLKVGEHFSAGEGAPAVSSESRRVSMELTTNCPVCNGAITPGQNPCPHCNATLDWA